jgi:hypothetical protein
MKFSEAILLSLSVAFFIIAVHQTFVLGIAQSYWLFMLSVTMLLLNKLAKKKQDEKSTQPEQLSSAKKGNKHKTISKVKSRK